ncbi:MAG: Manganese transport protein MntH [Candidatus Ozemobacter sibiricus]|uniref:Manganese transport protein MntH n=1 Tax=Candidatus Ozemobacter sibiricus TaxID=2268124 RepID=A0A367ZKZ8_9BACT|nr:MAG: Manganese transport protein MntH [Candidatus Ozemobacter sibiricus]
MALRTWWRRWRIRLLFFLSIFGPGLITATVDNDAGGIATYSLAGAIYGFDLLWTLIPITVLLIVTMEMSARLGAVTGQGLADLLRERFGVKATFWLLVLVFLANFGTVLSEFSGIASAIDICANTLGFGGSLWWLKYLLIPLITYGLYKIVTEYDYAKIEKVFLVSIFFYLAYPISAWMAGPDWGAAVKALFVPVLRFEAGYIFTMIAVIGTTITPWMQFYLQSTFIEKGITLKYWRTARWDVILGCMTTDIISFFMIVACAVTLCFRPGAPPVQTIDEIGKALAPLAGSYAGLLFALGLFNASVFGAAILPLSTSFAICEGMGWERGMNKTYEEAPFFYGIFIALLVLGAGLVLLPGVDFLYLMVMRASQFAQGLILPPFLYYLVKLGDDRQLLGDHANGPWLSRFSWVCVAVLTVLDLVLLGATVVEILG